MADLKAIQKDLSRLREARAAGASEARSAALRAEVLKGERAALERTATGSPGASRQIAALDREIASLEKKAGKKRADTEEIGARIHNRVTDFVRQRDGDPFEALDESVPFLLFPVRLETKFKHAGNGLSLGVRIFPDAINISTHDPLLSEGERQSGQDYWAERARALGLNDDQRRDAERSAWTLLAARYSGPRARYVARQTKPSPWPPAAGSGGTGSSSAGPEEESDVRLSHSVAPPRARLLPDQFIVIGFDKRGREVARAEGKPIPDTLMLGPDPEALDAELKTGPDGRLAADPKLRWLIDFDSALKVGMAVILDVPADEQQTGFHRLVAFGAKLTMEPSAGGTALEGLLAEHRFTGGIDLVRNGSPTNNTDDLPSAFTSDLSADEALVAIEVDGLAPVQVLDHSGKSDAQRLAEAFAISFDSISDWPSAPEGHDIAGALAMNRALWPATIGRFVKELTGKAISPALKTAIETFFLTYVTGRTLLPNIRVGRQPYGVLATGDLSAWQEPQERGSSNEMAVIAEALTWFRRRFEAMGPIAQVGGGGDDALANSMRVIGQLASSVTFASRKAVTDEAAWNTLNYTNVIPFFALNWWAERVAARDSSFADLPTGFLDSPFAKLVLFHDADPLNMPIVDQDPDLPLSEKARISPFDGARHYIDWLLTATTDDLKGEIFKDSAGQPIPAPKALLYRLLHDAWTDQLVSSSKDLFSRLHGELVATAASTSLTNIRESVVPEGHAPLFDARALGLSANSRALGDHLLDLSISGSPAPLADAPEALALLSQRAALEHLGKLSTAELERLFAEHVDLGAYRLDAWQTGLAARRLDLMRRQESGAVGLYLGAYGYVEEVVPKPKPWTVKPEELPETLRTNDVAEQEGNGGFVHAPSLGHAVTAAVLRNAYLTHAEPSTRELMSVNLTSRRVRSALALIEGIRAGQDLAALLGYQFERGLHENHPEVELDALIYVLRARFPLVSWRLTPVADGTPAELIEARNVIDGLDLLEQVRAKRDYPHDIGDLPGTGTDEATALTAELERLEEALDAVADLVLAESAHQAVQSNIDRVRGVVGAAGEGEVPPVPDVAFTPRSGRVFTQRVALHLPAGGAGWLTTPSPRALANPGLNAWLAAQLPEPNSIGFEVRRAGVAAETVTLNIVGLEPIDLVLMSTDRFGDGSGELERYLADRWRAAAAIGDDFVTLFKGPQRAPGQAMVVVDLAAAAGAIPLAQLLTQLRALRRLVGAARGLNAQDYRLAKDAENADGRNPKGFTLDAGGDLAEVPARIAAARDAFRTATSALEGRLDLLAPSYDAVRADAAAFDATAWDAPLDELRTGLRVLVLFGVNEAIPRSASGTSVDAALGLYEQGRAALSSCVQRLGAADAALTLLPADPSLEDPDAENRRLAGRLDRRLENLVAAARQLLGGNFPLQPHFGVNAGAEAELDASLASPVESDPLALESWLQSLARVRPRIGDIALAITTAAWTIGSEPRLLPVQLPRRAADPWIAQVWAEAPGDGEILSIMAIDPPASFAGGQEGLLIDDWTETVPGPNETTGLAFHFDRPNASAPQALLLVAPSQADGRWRKDELPSAILDTFARARLRAVEPDLVTASPLFPILPTAFSRFAHGSLFDSGFLARDLVELKFSTE